MVNEAIKYDREKARVELVPPDALLAIAEVLTYGAAKYAPRNWEKGMDHSRLVGACFRHLLAVMHGEEFDDESGLRHSAHLATTAMFLLAHQMRRIGTRDIPDLIRMEPSATLDAIKGGQTPLTHVAAEVTKQELEKPRVAEPL
jgi:hypothetical protein